MKAQEIYIQAKHTWKWISLDMKNTTSDNKVRFMPPLTPGVGWEGVRWDGYVRWEHGGYL